MIDDAGKVIIIDPAEKWLHGDVTRYLKRYVIRRAAHGFDLVAGRKEEGAASAILFGCKSVNLTCVKSLWAVVLQNYPP
ncbi:hypothetical protein [Paucibacter sp. KCTC 42545]|uniref:hypothetical protein n=1 Tax=Paucibacter sp. KCTC 42545 TaxID=1768242 RepID=UPI0018D22B6D|nr:hypothetical protein [Paucibacter sp. KCTC 42545]